MRQRDQPPGELTREELLTIAWASWHSPRRRIESIRALKEQRARLSHEEKAELAAAESILADQLETQGPVTIAGVTYTGEMGHIKSSLPW